MGLLDKIKQKQEETEVQMNSIGRSGEEIFKATPHFYSKPNGSIFGAIAWTEDTKTLLPINPKSDYKVDGMQVDEWIITFVSIPEGNKIEGFNVTREEAMSIIEDENLVSYNWYGDRDDKEDELVIQNIGEQWIVYATDERARKVLGSERIFDVESEALENIIKRLRADKRIRECQKKR